MNAIMVKTIVDPAKLSQAIERASMTRGDLAVAAGLSRSRIQALLASPSNVRSRTLKQLAGALSLRAEELLLNRGGLQEYLDWVIAQHSRIEFLGLGVPHHATACLSELYVSVDVSDPPPETGGASSSAAEDSLLPSPHPRPLAQTVGSTDRILLTGEPGGGKTTALRHLANLYAKALGGGGFSTHVPVFVHAGELLRSVTRGDPSTPAAVAAARVRELIGLDIQGHIAEALSQGSSIVLVDGLDEIAGNDRASEVIHGLVEFINTFPNAKYVVSGRPSGVDQELWKRSDFVHLSLNKWDDSQIEEFTRRWTAIHHGHHPSKDCDVCSEQTNGLFLAITSHDPVKEIATNPLMLVILATLHHSNVVLPRRRADLYGKVVETLVLTWERSKATALPGDSLHRSLLEAREYLWLLEAVALEMKKNGRVHAPRWWLAEKVRTFLNTDLGFPLQESSEEADRVIRYLRDRSGLMSEVSTDTFVFSHLTFLQYFAARGIVREPGPNSPGLLERLQPYLFHPYWREVVRLVASELPPKLVTPFVRALLSDPDPIGRFLHRGPLLALRCLSDGATIADNTLLDQMFSSLQELGSSRWLGITLEVLDCLHALRETRYTTYARETMDSILQRADEFLPQEESHLLRLWGDPGYRAEVRRQVSILDVPDNLGIVTHLELGKRKPEFVPVASEYRSKEPEAWRKMVLRAVECSDERLARAVLVGELGDDIELEQVSQAVVRCLQVDSDYRVRSACARVLAGVAESDSAVRGQLMDTMANDDCRKVRAECAAALRKAAKHQQAVRDRLLEVFESEQPGVVRAGAALALCSRTEDPELQHVFLQNLTSMDVSQKVRVRCAWALEDQVGQREDVTEAFLDCLNSPSSDRLQGVCAQIIAEALAEDKLNWSPEVVERAQQILLHLKNPCPHALWALESLGDSRELRSGYRMERVFRDLLGPIDSIVTAFVFGSMARNEQNLDSDIDLLVLGDISLKELRRPLNKAEAILSRRVNVVTYTVDNYAAKVAAGDPFLVDVHSKPRLFIKGQVNDISELASVL